jgi:hypothetical protein
MIDKLKKLLQSCKCGIYITINQHRDYYQSAEEYLKEKIKNTLIDKSEIKDSIYKTMIEKNTIIELQFYPNTPISFYRILHFDLNEILNEALILLEKIKERDYDRDDMGA